MEQLTVLETVVLGVRVSPPIPIAPLAEPVDALASNPSEKSWVFESPKGYAAVVKWKHGRI